MISKTFVKNLVFAPGPTQFYTTYEVYIWHASLKIIIIKDIGQQRATKDNLVEYKSTKQKMNIETIGLETIEINLAGLAIS